MPVGVAALDEMYLYCLRFFKENNYKTYIEVLYYCTGLVSHFNIIIFGYVVSVEINRATHQKVFNCFQVIIIVRKCSMDIMSVPD